MRSIRLIATLVMACACAVAAAGSAREELRFSVPPTISPEAAGSLRMLFGWYSMQPKEQQQPASLADWDRQRDDLERLIVPISRQIAQSVGATIHDDRIGDVAVVRIRPAGYQASGRRLLYTHGGAYVVLSARSTVGVPALVAAATGDEVISIDYTLAPRGNWRSVTDQVLAVWRALLDEGADPRSTGIFGDSAGGGLAAGSVLKMRDEGLPLPGALYLISPWTDVTSAGDTYQTLADVDPSLNLASLTSSAAAYAAPADQKHPYVSPVYGDYSKSFPPTLIQGGTREMFVSNFVRQYQAIRSGGHEAVLDLYEGMPHVFQGLVPASPETKTSIRRAADFFEQHLTARAVPGAKK